MRPKERFTLIELLVVIAIISILITILLPALRKARDLSKTLVCKNNFRSIGQAIPLYANDYDSYLPTSYLYTDGGVQKVRPWYYQDVIGGYLGPYFSCHSSLLDKIERNIAYCPGYSKSPYPCKYSAFNTVQIPISENSGILSVEYWYLRTCSLNFWIDRKGVRSNQIKSPSELLFIGEAWTKSLYSDWDQLYYNPRHQNQSPAVQLDGHVQTRWERNISRPEYTWAPNNSASRETVLTWGMYLNDSYTGTY